MPLAWLDHVNIRTARLEELTRFYQEVLGMELGPRPAFTFGGSWLYCRDRAVVHLVQTEEPPRVGEPQVEHFAFRASGLKDFLGVLDSRQVGYELRDVPGYDLKQVHLRDPDGNHIEVAFETSREEPV